MEQGGLIVHSSIYDCQIRADVTHYNNGEGVGGLTLDLREDPAFVSRNHEFFPGSIAITVCAVRRSDGAIAS